MERSGGNSKSSEKFTNQADSAGSRMIWRVETIGARMKRKKKDENIENIID